MKTRYSFRRACTLIVLVVAAAGAALAAAAEPMMSVDPRAPVAATLMPTLHVVADASNPDAEARWHIADEAPLQVTLMPTVRVSARAEPRTIARSPRVAAPAIAAGLRGHAVAAQFDGLDEPATSPYGLEVKPE